MQKREEDPIDPIAAADEPRADARQSEGIMSLRTEATIDDLYRADGKAELVGGEIVMMSPTGSSPNYAAGEIFVSLRDYARRTKRGRASTDNLGFVVDLPNRKSFSPDAAYYIGPLSMQFVQGRPGWQSKFVVKGTTVQPPNGKWQKSEPITSRRARKSFGMSTCKVPTLCASIEPAIPTSPRFTSAAESPKPSRQCRGGPCRLTTYSSLKSREVEVGTLRTVEPL